MPFEKEKYDELMRVIQKNKNIQGSLMPVLQEAQQIFGCVPEDVQKIIARELNITLSDVYGVVTFYAQFTLKPRGLHTISICLGTACYVKGSEAVLQRFAKELNVAVGETTHDGKYTLLATRCLGACGLAPVCMIDQDVYGRLKPENVADVLKDFESKIA